MSDAAYLLSHHQFAHFRMIEVRTVRSTEHLSDRQKAVGLLEREVSRALAEGDEGATGQSWGVVQAAEDNENFGYA